MPPRSVRSHSRKLSSGRTVQVREHQRQWLPVQYRLGLPVAIVGGAALLGAPLLAVAGVAGVYGALRHPRLVAGAARWAIPRARERARQLATRWRDAHSETTELDRRLSLLPPRPPLPSPTTEQRKRWALAGGSQGSYAAYSPRAWEVQASPSLTQLTEAQRQGKAEPEEVAKAAYQLAQAQWEGASAHSTGWRGKDGQAPHPVLERGGTEVLTRLHYQATAERNGLCSPGEQLAVDRETLWQRQAETEAVCALAAACTGSLNLSGLRNGQVDPESLTSEARDFLHKLHTDPPKGDKLDHLASTLARHYPVTKERAARVVRESLQLAPARVLIGVSGATEPKAATAIYRRRARDPPSQNCWAASLVRSPAMNRSPAANGLAGPRAIPPTDLLNPPFYSQLPLPTPLRQGDEDYDTPRRI